MLWKNDDFAVNINMDDYEIFMKESLIQEKKARVREFETTFEKLYVGTFYFTLEWNDHNKDYEPVPYLKVTKDHAINLMERDEILTPNLLTPVYPRNALLSFIMPDSKDFYE